MADPFSILAGTVGLADVCIRLILFLKEARDGFQKVDREIEELIGEISALRSVSDLVESKFKADIAVKRDPIDQQIVNETWAATKKALEGCQAVLEKLSALIQDVLGNGRPKYAKFKNLRKFLKQQSKEEDFAKVRQSLRTYFTTLQISLAAVNVIFTRESQSTSSKSFSELSQEIQSQGLDLQSKLDVLKASIESSSEKILNNSLTSAQNVVPLASLNQHFSTPQTVSTFYTGRAAELAGLRSCLLDPKSHDQRQMQRRFVLYGLPGAGKTQFCCKFALDHRQKFWGVFWIDASSIDQVKQSFSTIARVGRVEPNERAAKSWLSSLSREQPWLLIIDNADDLDFPVEDLFPNSDIGVILITTRNPVLKAQGNVGSRYFEFAGLGEVESTNLLLSAADEPLPWSQTTLDSAKDICKTLGYLPLALLHAGKTILGRSCTLENYLGEFEKNWARIRKLKTSHNIYRITDDSAAIYSSYELIHDAIMAKKTQASEDALDLLKIFAFLHQQRIRVDIFLRAALNPRLEKLEDQRRGQEEKTMRSRARARRTLRKTLNELGLDFLGFVLSLGYRPILPRLLFDALECRSFDEVRLRKALKELFQYSLVSVTPDPKDDSYSMHPAVHLWVRERPEMTIGDQAVWCHAAATTLAHAILLPPLGNKESDEIFRRDLLAHVSQVQSNLYKVQVKFAENQEFRRRLWPVIQPRLNKAEAFRLVKFSVVYAQCGLFEEAERLQLQVKDFCIATLGEEHTATMDIMLLLARTYQLTKPDKAADIQQCVLDVCMRVRGREDLKTLRIMDTLGSSRWVQGRYVEARRLLTAAIDGLKALLGPGHPDTLKAMGNLGRAVGRDFGFTKAINIHLEVVSGLEKQNGRYHLDTLVALDNLAMAYFDRAAFGYGRSGDLDIAVRLGQEVWQERKERLGKENLYTLWSGLNLARVKALRGEVDAALAIFLPGHEIARRNLGESHFGVLLGKMHYGRILTYAKRYEEAERTLLEVIESHDGSRKGHPDRLLALSSLIKCRNMMGKQDQTAAMLEEVMESTISLFGEDHPWVTYLRDPESIAEEPDDDARAPVEAITRVDSDIGCEETVKPVAMIAKYGHIKT